MSEPFFTMVVPTYNRAGVIRQTLMSLAAQTFRDYEVIIVDDGGKDETESVVKSVNTFPFQYRWKENAERAAARNYGARLAKGQYINFFDSDDVAYPNHLQDAHAAIEKLGRPAILHLGYDIRDAEGNLIRTVEDLPPELNDVLAEGNYLSCNGVFLRKDVALEFPFHEDRQLSASEDYELWLRLAARFTVHHVRTVSSTVVNHENRSVLKTDLEKLQARLRILVENLEKDHTFMERYSDQLGRLKAYLHIYVALHLGMSRHPRGEGLGYLYRALRQRPQVLGTRKFWGALKNIML